MSTKKDLMKFLNPGYTSGFVAIFPILIGLSALVTEYQLIFRIIIAVIMLGLGVMLIWQFFKSQRYLNEQITQLETSGKLDRVITEFYSGTVMCEGNLRMGETYVFGRKSGVCPTYGQITQIYQYIHKTNGFENYRALKIVTDDKKVHELCKIRLKGKADAEVQQIVGMILSKNPSVHVGYNN